MRRLSSTRSKPQSPLPEDRSYRALLSVPSVGRVLLGMQIARIGQSMVSVAIVLFALSSYRSPALAGFGTFFTIFPGLLVSPIAGALLDRHGRTRLVILDYLVALLSLTLMGVLALMGMLPAWLLMVIAAVSSLTMPLSSTGLRSLFPLIIPVHLWERVNAIDSMGYVVAAIAGPPLAATLVALYGGAIAFIVVGLIFGLAAIVIARAPDPPSEIVSSGSLLLDAWQGLVYTWRNPTLRALGFCISTVNLCVGAFTIVVPLIVLQMLHRDETIVGFVIAVQGITGMISAIFFGRIDSRNRERMMLALPMAVSGIVVAILLFTANLTTVVIVMAITGFLAGPLDIALFTLRQRRTDPAWTGRAFAVSMSLNYLGTPVGAALAGVMSARSIPAAIAFGVVACLISAAIAAVMIPSD